MTGERGRDATDHRDDTGRGAAAAALVGLAPPAAAAETGSIEVQLATPDGTAIRLADVELAAIGPTSSSGTRPPTPTAPRPSAGSRAGHGHGHHAAAPAARGGDLRARTPSGIAVRGGSTVAVTVPLVLGATVQGGVVGPSGPAAGRLMYAWNEDTSQVFRTTSDGAGQYRFVGLSTGPYRIEAYASERRRPPCGRPGCTSSVGRSRRRR